jgi:surface carbohydrate biosynthesis protein
MKRIYLMMEIKKRELEARIYFAMKAALRGYSVCLGKKYTIYTYRDYIKKGIVIFKSIGPYNSALIDRIKKSGHEIAAWDEEGMTFFEREYIDRRTYKENLKKLIFFFTWGDIDTKLIKDYHPDQSSKIKKVGNSRIDALRYPYHKIYSDEANEIKKKHGKFFLLPTLFTQCNSANLYDLSYVDSLLREGFKSDSPSVEIGRSLTVQQENILAEVNIFLKEFSEKCSEHKLIVRPHPSEKIQYWFDLIKKFKNIEIVFDDQSTCSWIAASEMTISINCTTAIEAFFLKKKSVNFLPFKDESVEFLLPKVTSKVIRSTEELINLIKDTKNHDLFDLKEEDKNIINQWLLNAFEGCSVDNLIDILESEEFKLKTFSEKKDKFSNFIFLIFLKFIRILKFRYRVLLSNKSFRLEHELTKQKFPGLTLEELNQKISFFSKFMNNEKFKVKEIYPGLFSIEKNGD